VLLKNFLNLFLKLNCSLCQRPTSSQLCPSCTKQLQKCQLNDPCVLWKQPTPVFAWGAYGGILKRSIAVMKYDQNPEIGHLLGQWLGQQWLLSAPLQAQKVGKLVVVPIPIHPNKLKHRGFNQAALISKGFCDVTGFQLKENGLRRVHDTQSQHGLSQRERKKNLVGAFVVGKGLNTLNNTKVLLVDDIYTTGATVAEAVITLNEARIEVIGIAATAIPVR
jgi:ComF family protein